MLVNLDLDVLYHEKSGIGWYAHYLTKELLKDKHIDFIYNYTNFLNRHSEFPFKIREQYGINVFENKVIPNRVRKLLKIPYDMIFKSDIFHSFSYILPKATKNFKAIATVHDVVLIKHPETMNEPDYKYLKNNIKDSLDRAVRIATVSNSSKRDIIELLNVPEEKIFIASPAVDSEMYKPNFDSVYMEKLIQKYKLPAKYILNVGTIEPRKNLKKLIESYNLLIKDKNYSELKLVIAGGSGWKNKDIYQRVNELALQDKVVFLGYVEDQLEKIAIYRLAQFLVYPSIYEGFGMPILEAMASSIPVITSNISSMPEVAGDAAILINPENPEEIAHSIKSVLDSEVLRKEMITKGLLRVNNYSWEKSAQNIITEYKKIL